MPLVASNSFKQAMKQPIKELRAKILNVNTGVEYKSTDDLQSFGLEEVGYYFGTVMRQVSFKLMGTTHDLMGESLAITLEVNTPGGWEPLDLGTFVVTEPDINLERGNTIFKAIGMMGVAAGLEYIAGDLTWPCTVAELASQVATKLGLTLGTDMTSLPNYNYTITEDLYAKINKLTYRDILSEIAGATATLCNISDQDGTLRFTLPPTASVEAMTYDNIKKIKYQPKYGPINTVTLARTPQEDNVVVRDEPSIITNGITELKLANNEILDDDRQDLAQPILDAVNGFAWFPFESTTEGHGWHSAGDRMSVTDGVNTWDVIVTYVKLDVAGGIKEVLKGIRPDSTQTDYARAGGIMKTIYNTEIKVDKQNQEIESVVSKVDELEGVTSEQYTQIIQNLNSITNTIQTTGGANMLYNSVGYATDAQHKPTVWIPTGTVNANTSAESLTFGAKSGNQINLVASSSISQSLIAAAGEPLSISARVKKSIVGSATITISGGNGTEETITLPDQTSNLWDEVSIVAFLPATSEITVTVSTDADITNFSITDLMLVSGDHIVPWQQASGEILNANVIIDRDGIVIRNSVYSGDYMKITPLEFANYSNASGSQQKSFWLNRDVTYAQKLEAVAQITMPPIKIVPLTDSQRAGWAFIKSTGSN